MRRPQSGWNRVVFFLALAASWSMPAAGAEWRERHEEGRKALAAGDLAQAEELMKQAIVAAKKLGPDHEAEFAEALVGLSDVYLKQERMTEANIVLERSLFLLAQTPGADEGVLDRIYDNLATVRVFQKNTTEAVSLLKRALALREKGLGANHSDVAAALDRMADLEIDLKNEEVALTLHERAVTIRERATGASPADVIKALNEGADWYERHGQHHDKSEALWKRALAIQERTLGADHPDVANTLMKVVALHLHLSSSGGLSIIDDSGVENVLPSKPTRALYANEILASFRPQESTLIRALAIREKALGPDHPDTIKVVEYLAGGYEVRADWARAIPLAERILAAREKALGAEHPDITHARDMLAIAAMSQHRYRDAIPHLKRLAARQAKEKAEAAKKAGSLDTAVRRARFDAVEEDDPNDYAAGLRRAIRLATRDETPGARPTEEDLAFFKDAQWCRQAMDLDGLNNLISLDLREKPIENNGLGRIRGLVNLKSLILNREIRIPTRTKPNINDDGLEQLRNLTALERLELTGTAIRGPGLSALRNMNELRYLDMSFTLVDDAGLAALPALPQLEYLNLGGTDVSDADAALPVLKRLTGLKTLVIYGTSISNEGAAKLRRGLPNATVQGPGF